MVDFHRELLLNNCACDYASVANKYGCSYGQVYAWVRKYKDKGIEGLYDRRGKNKAISQLSDIEKLKAENRLLKAQTQQSKKYQNLQVSAFARFTITMKSGF